MQNWLRTLQKDLATWVSIHQGTSTLQEAKNRGQTAYRAESLKLLAMERRINEL